MTYRQFGVLGDLFDQIKTKIGERTLEYEFVKDGLKELLEGPKLRLIAGNYLSVMGTFEVSPTTRTEMTDVDGQHGEHLFQGYKTKLKLGPFFFGESPETSGGTGAVLASDQGLTILDFTGEILGENMDNTDWDTLEERIFTLGFSFSIKQVMEILESGAVSSNIVGTKKRTLVFLVHDDYSQVGAVTISSSHKGLFGKSLDDKYIFKSAAFVVRNLPKHLQK